MSAACETKEREGEPISRARDTDIARELADACAAKLLHDPALRVAVVPSHRLDRHGHWAMGRQ